MPTTAGPRRRHPLPRSLLTVALGLLLGVPAFGASQTQEPPGTQGGEWRYIGGDGWHTRYSPLDQVDASNFSDLAVE